MHFFEPLELLLGFLEHLLGHLGVFDALAEFRHFLRPFVQLAEFFLDGFQLLAQKVFALGLVHLPFGLRLDLLLHGEDIDFLGENFADLAQPLNRVHDLQDGLRDVDLQSEIGGHHVGEPAGVFQIFDDHHHVGNQHLAEADDLLDLLLDRAHDGLGLQCGSGLLRLDEFLDANRIIGVVLDVFFDPSLGESLD